MAKDHLDVSPGPAYAATSRREKHLHEMFSRRDSRIRIEATSLYFEITHAKLPLRSVRALIWAGGMHAAGGASTFPQAQAELNLSCSPNPKLKMPICRIRIARSLSLWSISVKPFQGLVLSGLASECYSGLYLCSHRPKKSCKRLMALCLFVEFFSRFYKNK